MIHLLEQVGRISCSACSLMPVSKLQVKARRLPSIGATDSLKQCGLDLIF